MKNVPLFFPFCLALFIAFFGTAFCPSVRLMAFAPFIAIVTMRTSFSTSLWWALICGLVIDLLSAQLRFGMCALNYCLTTALVYKQKRHFFDDKPVALSLYTALIACVSTALQLFFLFTMDKGLPFTWKIGLTDLLGMPILDALYAFLWFTCPLRLYVHIKRVGLRSFLRKKAVEEEEKT